MWQNLSAMHDYPLLGAHCTSLQGILPSQPLSRLIGIIMVSLALLPQGLHEFLPVASVLGVFGANMVFQILLLANH